MSHLNKIFTRASEFYGSWSRSSREIIASPDKIGALFFYIISPFYLTLGALFYIIGVDENKVDGLLERVLVIAIYSTIAYFIYKLLASYI